MSQVAFPATFAACERELQQQILQHRGHPHATLWIDTEFNSWGGQLISLALVDQTGREFYEAVRVDEPLAPWVAEHVVPVLHATPRPVASLQARLALWLSGYASVHIVADWPDDVAYFCRALITGPGKRLDTPALTFEIRRDLDAVSAVPHNALEDAKAMRALHLQLIAAAATRPSAGCDGKDTLGCWHVRCQLGGKCLHGDASAARAGGEAGGEFQSTIAGRAGGSPAPIGTSDAGAAGVVSAFGAGGGAATTRPAGQEGR